MYDWHWKRVVSEDRGKKTKKIASSIHVFLRLFTVTHSLPILQHTLVVAAYNTVPITENQQPGEDREHGSGLMVEASDPSENVVFSKTTDLVGRFAFTTAVSGEHALCFKTNTTSWFGHGARFKFYLDITVGARAHDYEKIAKLEHLNKVDVSIRRLTDIVAEVRAEQKYLREREGAWRLLSETVHSGVIWWSVMQMIILIASGLFQMRSLKNFFKTKKLV
jgi:hypothetical protein